MINSRNKMLGIHRRAATLSWLAIMLMLPPVLTVQGAVRGVAQQTTKQTAQQTIQGATQQETPPSPAQPRSVRFPQPVERVLSNGLRVIVIERGGVPLVAAQLLIKNGGEVDPPMLAGLADMTAALLTKGTTTRTAPQIAEAIERLGGTLTSDARWDGAMAGVSVMTLGFDSAMRILADVVRRPAFQAEEIDRLRQQVLDNLSIELREPGELARFVAARVVFGDAPYGHLLSGTPETVARIKREDVLRLHATHYRPDNAVLVVGGDIKPGRAFKIAEEAFGDWSKAAATTVMWALAAPTALATSANADREKVAANRVASAGPRVVVVDMPDAGQAAVVLARTGLKRTDVDYYQALVANSVLGGGYSARLNQEIRIKRGLSYGANSSLEMRREVGPFLAATQTKNESVAEVAALLINELGHLSNGTLPESELIPRKAVVTGNFARNLETSGGLVGQISQLALYGLSLDTINSYINDVQAVTASDVQRLAGSRLNSKEAHIIIVGDAKKFLGDLRKQFPGAEIIPAAQLDLNSAALRRTAPVVSTSETRKNSVDQ